MIIVRLKGGLGNQMFQYALGRALSMQNRDSLKLDVGSFRTDFDRRIYSLSAFNISESIASPSEIRAAKHPWGPLSRAIRFFSAKVLKRRNAGWEPRILRAKGNVYLDGFWQSFRYFDGIADTIRHDFTLKEPLHNACPEICRLISGTISVSLHIRRSDYAYSPQIAKLFGACSPEYYRQAARIIAAHARNPAFLVFSDDSAWAREHLCLEHSAVFAADFHLRDYQEMAAMSLCRHHIIANSTFSWWAAWLDPKPGALVIAPDRWINDGRIGERDLLPPAWMRIPREARGANKNG